MYDGVHPNAHLKAKWYNSLCQSINNDIEGVLPTTYELEDEDDRESWDFKRVMFE